MSLLPIGHFLGAFHPGPGTPASHHAVRVGRRTVRLPDDDHRDVWALAHGARSRAALLTAAADVPDADTIVDTLLAQGALAEISADAKVTFAVAHRLAPLLTAVDDDELGVAGLLVAARPGPWAFELWQWAPRWPDLWSACRDIAEAAGEPDPLVVLDAALDATGALIERGAAYLDARIAPGPASVG